MSHAYGQIQIMEHRSKVKTYLQIQLTLKYSDIFLALSASLRLDFPCPEIKEIAVQFITKSNTSSHTGKVNQLKVYEMRQRCLLEIKPNSTQFSTKINF